MQSESDDPYTITTSSLFLSFSLCLSVCLSLYLAVSLSFCLSVSFSSCLSVSVCLPVSVCLYFCRCLCLSACLSACLCLSLFLSLSLSVCLSVCPSVLTQSPVYTQKHTLTFQMKLTGVLCQREILRAPILSESHPWTTLCRRRFLNQRMFLRVWYGTERRRWIGLERDFRLAVNFLCTEKGSTLHCFKYPCKD